MDTVPSNCVPKDASELERTTASVPQIPAIPCTEIAPTTSSIFNLSKIWWLVCPENPIKSVTPSDLNSRFLASKKIMKHPSVVITDLTKKF